MKNLTKLLYLATLAAFLASEGSVVAQTADTNTPAASTKHKSKKSSTTTVSGVVASVDNDAKTITLKDHDKPYQVTSKTKITKKGEPALLTDFVAGDKVSIRAKEDAAGMLAATSIQTPTKPKKKKKPAPAPETSPAETAPGPATPVVPAAPISNTPALAPPLPPSNLHVTNSP